MQGINGRAWFAIVRHFLLGHKVGECAHYGIQLTKHTQILEYNCTRVFIIILSTKHLKSTVRIYLVIKLLRNVRMYHKVLVQKQINGLCCNPPSRHILSKKMTPHHIRKRDYHFTKKDILCNYNRFFDLYRQADISEVTGGCWLMIMVCTSRLAMPRLQGHIGTL